METWTRTLRARLTEPAPVSPAGLWVIAAFLVMVGMTQQSLSMITMALPVALLALWRPVGSGLLVGATFLLAATSALDNSHRLVEFHGAAVAAAALWVVVAAAWAPLGRIWSLALGVAFVVVVLVTMIPLGDAGIDVAVFNRVAGESLLHGRDPWTATFRSIYAPQYDDVFYGPGLVVDGVLQVSYPYTGVAAIVMAIGVALGSFRIGVLGLMAAGALALGRFDRRTASLAALLVMLPGAAFVDSQGWTEPLSIGLLALAVAALLRRSGWAPVWLGLLLVSKQYFVIAVPLLVLLLPRLRELPGGLRRSLLVGAAAAVVTTLPFLLWNPSGFWRSVVEFQLRQPFRADSTSLLVYGVAHWHWPSHGVAGVLSLGLGLVAAVLLAWRAPRTPSAFAGSVAIVLLVTVLFSKQAFINYYFMIAGALMVAAVASLREAGGEDARAFFGSATRPLEWLTVNIRPKVAGPPDARPAPTQETREDL